MPPENSRRQPGLMIACLWFALVVVVLALGTRSSQAAAGPLIWVRQDGVVINANKDPLRYESPDPRFEGSFTQYAVAEGAISKQERFVDHGYEFYDVTIDTQFDRPPLVITPPLRYKMNGSYAHGGTYNGGGMVGAKLHYYSDWAHIEPAVIQGYFPWEPWYEGNATREWMISAPAAAQAGQIMKVTAYWIDGPPCNVTWTYAAEPAYEVEQLEAQVVAPVVAYQGEEVAPGETFFPGICALPDGRASVVCSYTTEISSRGWVDMKCAAAQQEKLLSILEFIDLSAQEENNAKMKELVAWIVAVKIADNCAYNRSEVNDYQLELGMEQGGMVLSNAVTGQSLVVHTPLGKATAAKTGTLLAGYNPDAKVATFRSYSVPIVIQSKAGPSLTLPPGRQVRLTPTGFGPVTPLRQVFLPATIR